MTVKQLLDWAVNAYGRHDESYNDILDKHSLCLKQALLKTKPTKDTHGYVPSSGEIELAIVITYTLSLNELYELSDLCYCGEDGTDIPLDPIPNIEPPTLIHNFTLTPDRIVRSQQAAIRAQQAANDFLPITETIHIDRAEFDALFTRTPQRTATVVNLQTPPPTQNTR